MSLEVFSDYGSGGSMNSSTSWGSQDHVDWATHLRPIAKPRPKSISFLDTVVTGSCSVEDAMREFRLNGSDSPYDPQEDLWAYSGEWTGLGAVNTYLRQKSWPAPERTPARPLPPPPPPPAPAPAQAQAWPSLAADEFNLTLSSDRGQDYTLSPMTSRFAPAQPTQDYKSSPMDTQVFTAPLTILQPVQTSTVTDFTQFPMAQDFMTSTMGSQDFNTAAMGLQGFKTSNMDSQDFNNPNMGLQVFKTSNMGFQNLNVGLQGFKTSNIGSQDFNTASMGLQVFKTSTMSSEDFKTPTMGPQDFSSSTMGLQDYKASSVAPQDFKSMADAIQPPLAQSNIITEEQRRVLYSIPPETLHHVLQQLDQGFAKRAKRYPIGQECRFCKKNRERESCYRSHSLKDESGRVLCPVLRQLTCTRCGASGDRAHTLKYCGLTTAEERMQAHAMMRSVRMASDRRRYSRPQHVKFDEASPSALQDTAAAFREMPLDPLWAALERKLML